MPWSDHFDPPPPDRLPLSDLGHAPPPPPLWPVPPRAEEIIVTLYPDEIAAWLAAAPVTASGRWDDDRR